MNRNSGNQRLGFWLVGLTFWLLASSSVLAAQHFASPQGNDRGAGTLLSPWSLQHALTNIGIMPGDTLWLRAGTYTGTNVALLNGAPTNPIIIRNYNGERAILDGSLNTRTSSNLWLWGLEFIDSLKSVRVSPYNTIAMQGIGTAIINCLIHDCCIGIAPRGPYLVYGNIMWNCGKDSGMEHSMYLQNDSGMPPKIVQDNLLGRASGFGIHVYGSAGGMSSVHLLNNTIWQNDKFAILFGGGKPIMDGMVVSNRIFQPMGSGALRLGHSAENDDILVAGNYLLGRNALLLSQQFTRLVVTNNILASAFDTCINARSLKKIEGAPDLNHNKYYKQNFASGRNYFIQIDTNNFLGAAWQNATGFDSDSYFNSTGYPLTGSHPPDLVEVRPNAYETKRGHVIIYNFSGSNSVPVNLSSILSPGDPYLIRSALNYFDGPQIKGVYAGGTVLLPMTGQTLAIDPYYANPSLYRNTATNFNAFVVMGFPDNLTNLPPRVRDFRVIPPS